jgi:outer membrane protein TolC
MFGNKYLLLFGVCSGLSGCLSTADMNREIADSRSYGYKKWEASRNMEERDTPCIEGSLSLEDALKLSLANNKELLAALQNKSVSQGRILASRNTLLPTISFLGSYTRYDDDAYNKGVYGSLDEYSTSITVKQPLYRGGALSAERRLARLLAFYNDDLVQEQVETTLYNVTLNYYKSLLAQQLLKVTQDAVVSAEAYLDEVEKKRKNGASTDYSVLRARVDVAIYQAQMIQKQNALHMSMTQFLKEMGVDQNSHVELSGELVYKEEKPAFKESVRIAYENRADLGQAYTDVKMQEESLKLISSHYLPQVNAFASGGWSNPNHYKKTIDEWDAYASAGICFEYLLFDGFKREGQMKEERSKLSMKQYELLNTQESIALQVNQALLNLNNAEEFVESQQMNMNLAKEGLRLAQIGYRNGVNTEIDVIDARSALTNAMGLHYQAIYDHSLARLVLRKACGILLQNDSSLALSFSNDLGKGAE